MIWAERGLTLRLDATEYVTAPLPVAPEFEYFATVGLANRDLAIKTLNHILRRFSDSPGIVVETEYIVAKIDIDGMWSAIPFDQISPIESAEVGFERATTLPFEIHHAFDLTGDRTGLQLDQLLCESSALGLWVGGWYSFMKDSVRAYRSNAFSEPEGLEEHVRAQHELLDQYLRQSGLNYRLWTLVEKVIGVWRTPSREIAKI